MESGQARHGVDLPAAQQSSHDAKPPTGDENPCQVTAFVPARDPGIRTLNRVDASPRRVTEEISSFFVKAANVLGAWSHDPFPPVAEETDLTNMTKTDQTRSLSDLRAQIEAGSLPTPAAAPVLAFLDLAEASFGADFHECDMLSSETLFSRHFPSEPDEALSQAFGDATLYRRCRESLHRHARLAGLWENAPYSLLNRLAKEKARPGVNRKMMEAHFPDLPLSAITRDKALAVDRRLRGRKRATLRNSLATMDHFRADPRVVAAGILGAEKIGPMPMYRDGDKHHIELPVALAAALDRIPVGQANRARRAFELAVDFGILQEDPPSGTWSMSEEDALRYHATVREQISDKSAQGNLRALISLLRAGDPDAVPSHVTVDQVRRPERYAPAPEPATDPAPERRKTDRKPVHLPSALEAEVSEFASARSTSPKRINALRRFLHELIDAGYDIDDPAIYTSALSLLETRFTGYSEVTLRSYCSVLHTFLAHTNRLSPWATLMSRVKLIGSNGIDMAALLLINKFAETRKPAIDPAGIDRNFAQDFVTRAQERGETAECLRGLKSLDLLRKKLPDLLPGPAIGDLQGWLQQMSDERPKSLEAALRADAIASGYSKYAVRARIVAVRALYALTRNKAAFEHEPAKIPWRMLIDEARAGYPDKFSSYHNEWKRLASQYDRRWSGGWRSLQTKIVKVGIPRSDNPVEPLMEVALEAALEPWQLDREWAWDHERSLRPDLRRKWTRMINCFDALHDVPGIKESGLLPAERLGPMPANGARLKNGHLPLPRRFEAVLDGESKQVLEAAHFLCRCLREFGIYSRGDDPAPGALVSEAHLDRVMAEQSFMTPQSARLHIERIRDWRESWPIGLIGTLEEVAAQSGSSMVGMTD